MLEKEDEREEERMENSSPLGFQPFFFNLKPIFPSSLITQIDSDLNPVNCFTTELLTSLPT